MPKSKSSTDNSFGRIAMAQGWVTPIQLEDTLKTAQKLADLGFREKIGAVMVKKGYLTAPQVNEILLIQGKRARNRIKGYEIISKLGQGGMGAVFKARQLSLDREVALKILSPSRAKDRAYVARFLREARAVARLNHRHIIQGIDVGESGGHYYFAMEFVDGPTLQEVIRSKGPVSEDRALKIVAEVAKALSHAHKHKLIHRDIKPDNIMIDRKGESKLCDLGLAKFQAGEAGGASRDGEGLVFGTPHYISPEQARGERTVDIRSDIYSLGATLFHSLTGQTPFSGGRSAAIMTKHVTDPVRDPREIRPDVSEGAALLVLRMMAKRPADRYPDPDSLLQDVSRVSKGKTPKDLSRPAAKTSARTSARTSSRAGAKASARSAAKASARAGAEPTVPPAIEHRHHRKITRRLKQQGVMQYVFGAGALLVIVLVVLWLLSLGVKGPSSSAPGRARPGPETPEPTAPAGTGPEVESASETHGRILFERAAKFASAEENAENFPEILKRLRQVEEGFPGTSYADKARRRRGAEAQRQAQLCGKRFGEMRERAAALVKEGGFREAYALWDSFPENLLPESETRRKALLEAERRAIVKAADAHLSEIVEFALAAVESGDGDAAREMLAGASKIGIAEVTERLSEERRLLEEAIGRHEAGAARLIETVWRERRDEITGLAHAGEFEQALKRTRETIRDGKFAPWRKDLDLLEYDMRRMGLRQEIALEAYASRAGKKERVYIHKGSRGYAGQVVKVDGDRIIIRPVVSAGGTVAIRKQELSSDDIRRYAQIVLSDAAGNYDLSILLVYSGKAAKAKPYLIRCRRDPQVGAYARRHLEALGQRRPGAGKRRAPGANPERRPKRK